MGKSKCWTHCHKCCISMSWRNLGHMASWNEFYTTPGQNPVKPITPGLWHENKNECNPCIWVSNLLHICLSCIFIKRTQQNLNKVILLCIDSIYSLYYIYFSQCNYITKAQVKAKCFDLKSRQAKLRTMNVAACFWDPRWLTMCAVIHTLYITWLICTTISTTRYIQGTNHSTHCEPSGIPNAHSHIHGS